MPGETAFTIIVVNRNEEFQCRPENSLLSGMEYQQKQAINVGCRGGGCGICKIRILSGDYETKKMSTKHVSIEQRKTGIALSCRIFPRSNMVIESDLFEDLNHSSPT